MAMHAVSVTPLIASLQDAHVKQVWFADDATAGGTLHGWWSCRLQDLGSYYGYYPNAFTLKNVVCIAHQVAVTPMQWHACNGMHAVLFRAINSDVFINS